MRLHNLYGVLSMHEIEDCIQAPPPNLHVRTCNMFPWFLLSMQFLTMLLFQDRSNEAIQVPTTKAQDVADLPHPSQTLHTVPVALPTQTEGTRPFPS